MTLREYLDKCSVAEKEVFWQRLGRSKRRDRIYIYSFNDKRPRRRPSPVLARAINAASDGLVSLAELRPDIWGSAAVSPPRKVNGRAGPRKRKAV